jgi:hypothetical protein
MRKKQTFLLTILTPEDEPASFCGKIKIISSGRIYNFTSLEELNALIVSEMDQNLTQKLVLSEVNPKNI